MMVLTYEGFCELICDELVDIINPLKHHAIFVNLYSPIFAYLYRPRGRDHVSMTGFENSHFPFSNPHSLHAIQINV